MNHQSISTDTYPWTRVILRALTCTTIMVACYFCAAPLVEAGKWMAANWHTECPEKGNAHADH